MLRFEREKTSKTLSLRLRHKKSFWTRELLLASGIALFFHVSAFLLFSIHSFPWDTLNPQQTIEVSSDFIQAGAPVDFSFRDNLTKTLLPPPKPVLPSLLSSRVQGEIPLRLDFSKKTFSGAYVRGPFPEKLPIPSSWPPSLQLALLSIRSDASGKVFWLEWLEKTTNESLNHLIETWIKEIHLKPENAYQANLLEIHLSL